MSQPDPNDSPAAGSAPGPMRLYHVAPISALPSIFEEGLNPERSRSSLKAVFLAGERHTAVSYALFHDEPCVVLEVLVPEGAQLSPDNYELPDLLEQAGEDELAAWGMESGTAWSDCTWKQSLRIVDQVACFSVIPPDCLKVDRLASTMLQTTRVPLDSECGPMAWPTYSPERVFHIGTLDAQHKLSQFESSLEGSGLSVSECPEAWAVIADLGGQPTWELTRGDQAEPRFLDVHSLSDAHWEQICAWGRAQQLVEDAWLLRAHFVDAETEEERFFEYRLEHDGGHATAWSLAIEEVLDAGQSGESHLSVERGVRALPALEQRVGFSIPAGLDRDMLMTVFVEEVLLPGEGIQGAWWLDVEDEANLSAPRGVIAKRALDGWASSCVREIGGNRYRASV